MSHDLSQEMPSIVNEAVFNVAVRFNLIEKQFTTYKGIRLNLSTYIDRDSKGFNFISQIKKMKELSTTIENSKYSPPSTTAEYFKTLNQFITQVATAKNMASSAVSESIFVEVTVIRQRIVNAELDKIVQQQQEKNERETFRKAKEASERDFEETVRAYLFLGGLALAVAVSWMGISALTTTLNQRVLNIKELQRVTAENVRLKEENQLVKGQLKDFEKYREDFKNVAKVKAENQKLKDQNTNLSSALAECKARPIWKPCR